MTSGGDVNQSPDQQPAAEPATAAMGTTGGAPPAQPVSQPTAARYFARIIRAVVVSSLGFGGGIGLLVFITFVVLTGKSPNVLPIALKFACIFGIGFGFVLALLLLLSDLSGRLYAAKGLHGEVWELNQTREVELQGTLREVRAWGRTAFQEVPNIKSVVDEENECMMKASVGRSWKSPGEDMHLLITPMDSPTKWKVTVSSTCVSPLVAFDYGKNFENVESWLRGVKKKDSGDSRAMPVYPPKR